MARTKKSKTKDPMPGPNATDREVAEFWDAHSSADYWDEMEPVEVQTPRHAPRQIVTLRLDPGIVRALRALARKQGLEHSVLLRSWIVERVREELHVAGRK